jgi:cytochrome P450 family 135
MPGITAKERTPTSSQPTLYRTKETLPPGPRLPAAAQAYLLWRAPVHTMLRWRAHYGDVFTMHLPTLGPVVVIGGPEDAHRILLSDPADSKAGQATGYLLPLLGPTCMLRLDGAAHQERRRLLNPVFHSDNLQRHLDRITSLTAAEIATWPANLPMAVLPRMQNITFAVIAHLALGLTDPARIAALHQLVRLLTGPTALAGTWLAPFLTPPGQRLCWSQIRIHQRAIDRFLDDEIRRRQTASGEHEIFNALDLLLNYQQTKDSRLSDVQVHEELRALLVVGHETTAAALAWAVERLVHEPAVYHAILDSLAAGNDTFVKALVYEVLRWRPPVIDTVRLLTEATEAGGTCLPAQTLVMVAPLLIHQHPRLYASPSAFVPDRFVGLGRGGNRPNPLGWIPFGGGARRCLGATLATMEIETVLSTLLANVTLTASDPRPEPARLRGTMMVPARGGRVVVSQHGPATSRNTLKQ